MSNTDKFVNEAFVDELLKSGVWDIARVDRGSREDEEINEALLSEGEDKKDDKPDFMKGDEPKTKKSNKGKKDDGDDEDDEDDDGEKNESVSARDLAEELINHLSEDVILEFIDLLYTSALNEEEEVQEEDAEEASE